MPWYAIYNMETGALVSLATELAEIPASMGYVECDDVLPDASKWDPEKRAFLTETAANAVPEQEDPGDPALAADGEDSKELPHGHL